MTHLANKLTNRPAWVELSTSDPSAARDLYSNLVGWNVGISDDPQYGGYATAHLDEHTTAGIGPKQDPNMPTVWGLYIGTDDIDALAAKVAAAGGTVIAPPFDVGEDFPGGRFAIMNDPQGASFAMLKTTPRDS